MAMKTLSITVDDENAGRVDLVVRGLCELPRSQVRGLFDHGCVSINKAICANSGKSVSAGQVVSVCFDPHQRYKEKKRRWEDRTFTVVFEDDDLIVVDKVAGTLTVPTDNEERNTLLDRVALYLSHSRRDREACLVHRLDRAVSGLLVFGKHEKVAQALIEQFKHQKPERVYAAIVAGVMESESGTLESHLATGRNLDRYVARPSKDTERAVTHYQVHSKFADTTLVDVTLETGKRNQIRVQFADEGHPVLGDPRYKSETASHPRWIRSRIALHAKTLGFIHPKTGEPVSFESPMPSAMKKFIAGSKMKSR
jgi:23S rRNA pseudouridine1911/1915/1917 synthase